MAEVLKDGERVRLEAESEFAPVVLGAARPVLLFFRSDSCKPCREQGDIIERLMAEAPGRFIVALADTEEVPGIAQRLGVLGLPTLVIYRGGVEGQRFIGLTSYEALKSCLCE